MDQDLFWNSTHLYSFLETLLLFIMTLCVSVSLCVHTYAYMYVALGIEPSDHRATHQSFYIIFVSAHWLYKLMDFIWADLSLHLTFLITSISHLLAPPFLFYYFQTSLVTLPRLALNLQSSCLMPLSSWDFRHVPQCLAHCDLLFCQTHNSMFHSHYYISVFQEKAEMALN